MGAYGTPPKLDGFRFGSVNRPSPPLNDSNGLYGPRNIPKLKHSSSGNKESEIAKPRHLYCAVVLLDFICPSRTSWCGEPSSPCGLPC